MNQRQSSSDSAAILKELTEFKAALDVSAIVGVTDINGVITHVNDTFCRTSQYSRDELIGKTHRVVNSGYHPKEFFQEMWETIKSGHVWQGEIRNRAKDGTIYWVDTTIVPFMDEHGRPYRYVSIRRNITRRKQLEEEIAQVPQKIIRALEDERERISREMHDDLGQALVALKMMIQSNDPDRMLNIEERREIFKKQINYVDDVIQKIRRVSRELHPVSLESVGLFAAVRSLLDEYRMYGIVIESNASPVLDNLRFESESIALYRIIQEALTNVIRHARATRIRLNFEIAENFLDVIVEDNGCGFETGTQGHGRGIGLITMRERARLLKGSLTIDSRAGTGTRLKIRIPAQQRSE